MAGGSEQGIYWGIDVPGLTKEQAGWLVSVVNTSPHNLDATATDPARWFTVRVDRSGAEVLLAALGHLPEDDTSNGLKEIIQEWLEFAGEDQHDGIGEHTG